VHLLTGAKVNLRLPLCHRPHCPNINLAVYLKKHKGNYVSI